MLKFHPHSTLVTVLILVVLFGATFFVHEKWEKEELVVTLPIINQAPLKNPDTSDWKTYLNDTLKFSIKYPGTFKINDKPTNSGSVVSFMEFDQHAKNINGQESPGYFSVISVYQWSNINDPNLKGGSWEGEMNYSSLQDFIADSEHTSVSVIGESNIDGIKTYILSMPGEIGYEAIMFEYNDKYYRISFPWTQKKLDEETKKQFISSIKFTK